jgi:hypothetical protein
MCKYDSLNAYMRNRHRYRIAGRVDDDLASRSPSCRVTLRKRPDVTGHRRVAIDQREIVRGRAAKGGDLVARPAAASFGRIRPVRMSMKASAVRFRSFER